MIYGALKYLEMSDGEISVWFVHTVIPVI